MEFKDYYDILGVSRGASADEIKRAYRRLARKYHPDVSKAANAEARFKEMKEAYEVLRDPGKRAAYDQFGKNRQTGQDFQPPPDWDRQFSFGDGGFTGAGNFSDFFETLFGGGGARGAGARQPFHDFGAAGDDVNARITISLEDAYRGVNRQITLEVPAVDSSGQQRRQRRKLNVKIPRGVTAGQRIRLEGQGDRGVRGGQAGNLYLQVEFEPHPVFQAKGRDIHLRLPVAPWEAALGRKVKVPTLGGKVDLKIPAAASSGKTLRLKGRGLPGKPPGDQYVEIEVVIPTPVTREMQSLYEQLERLNHVNPRQKLGV